MNPRPTILAAALTALAPLGVANADVLNPGDTIFCDGTTAAESPWLQGPSTSGLTVPFTIRDSQGNTVLAGTILISFNAPTGQPFGRRYPNYCVQNMTGVPGRALHMIEFMGFRDSGVDAEYRSDLSGGAQGPLVMGRSDDGDTISVVYHEPAPIGQNTGFFYIYTGEALVNTGTARVVANTGEEAFITGLPVPARPTQPTPCDGDVDGDNLVNFIDLNTVLSNYGRTCSE